jgi:hypothetical protein
MSKSSFSYVSEAVLGALGATTFVAVFAGIALLASLPALARAETCPNEAVRSEQGATRLPDCRAYEQVTPVYKNGNGRWNNPAAVSSDGSSLLFGSKDVFAAAQGSPAANGLHYSMRRTESGWVTTPQDPPVSEYEPYIEQIVSADAVFELLGGTSADGRSTLWAERELARPDSVVDYYIRRADGSIADIGPIFAPGTPDSSLHVASVVQAPLVGISADASHVLFTLGGTIQWPSAEEGQALYEYIGTGNTEPLLVGVDDKGHQISRCGTGLGVGSSSAYLGRLKSSHDAMSVDGKTVFFTADACGASPSVNEIFARIDNGEPGAHTIAISEPSKADCSACDTEAGVLAGASFEGASENGEKVLFSTGQPLLDGAGGLYEYDASAPAGEKVRLVAPGGSVIEISEDGSHVYFSSANVLSMAPNYEGQYAQPGYDNTYVYDTQTGQTSFLTDAVVKTPDVTPDGRFMVFTSASDLTPDDTSSAEQVFEYEAPTEAHPAGLLIRVSIGQAGFNHNGNTNVYGASFQSAEAAAEFIDVKKGSYSSALYSTYRWVSADGQYVFFESADGLTPQALPGLVSVYEYHDGVVSLISDGHDITKVTGFAGIGGELVSSVRLIGTDASGGDVFFTTADSLVPQDTDDNIDVYDARIGGGFPAPPAPPTCSGDACQGPLSAAPTLLSPGSEFQASVAPPLAAAAPAQPAVKSKKKNVKKKQKRSRKKAKRSSNKRRAK